MRCLTRIRLPLVAIHQSQSLLPCSKISPYRHYSSAADNKPKKSKTKKFSKHKKKTAEEPRISIPHGRELNARIEAEALARSKVLTDDEKEEVLWEISNVKKSGRHEGVWDRVLGGVESVKDEVEVEAGKVDLEKRRSKKDGPKIRLIPAVRRKDKIVRPVSVGKVEDEYVEERHSEEDDLKIRRVGALRWRGVVRPVSFGEVEAGGEEQRPVEDSGVKIRIVTAPPRRGLILLPSDRFYEREDGDVEGSKEDVVDGPRNEAPLKEGSGPRSVHFKGIRKVKLRSSDGERFFISSESRTSMVQLAAEELQAAEEPEMRESIKTQMRGRPSELIRRPMIKIRRVLATPAEESETAAQDATSQPFWKRVATPFRDENTNKDETPTFRLVLAPAEKKNTTEKLAKASQERDIEDRIAKIVLDSRLTKKDNLRALHFARAAITAHGSSKPVDQESTEMFDLRVRRYISFRVHRPKSAQFKLKSRFTQRPTKAYIGVRRIPSKTKGRGSNHITGAQEAVLDPMAAFDAMWSGLDSSVSKEQKTSGPASDSVSDVDPSAARNPSEDTVSDEIWSDTNPGIPPIQRLSNEDSSHAKVPDLDQVDTEAIASERPQTTAPIRKPTGRKIFDAMSSNPKSGRRKAARQRRFTGKVRKFYEGVRIQKYASNRGVTIRKQFSVGMPGKEKEEVDPESPRERARRMTFERRFELIEDEKE